MLSEELTIKLITHLLQADEFFGLPDDAKNSVGLAIEELDRSGVDVDKQIREKLDFKSFQKSFYESEKVVFEVLVANEFAEKIRFQGIGPISGMRILEGDPIKTTTSHFDQGSGDTRYYLVFASDKELAIAAEKLQSEVGQVSTEIKVVADQPFKLLRKVFV